MAHPNLQVSGFAGHLLALNGVYQPNGENHGKVQYKKIGGGGAGQESCIYFWDARDGENLSGWWVAPIVGGEQVWAHCLNQGNFPPGKGWKVPWHKPEPDAAVSMVPMENAKRDFEAFGGAGGNVNKMARTMDGMQPLGSFGNQGGWNQGGGYGKGGKGKGKNNIGFNNYEANRMDALKKNVETSLENAEKAVAKLDGEVPEVAEGEELPEKQSPNIKDVEMAKKMYTAAQKMYDTQCMRLDEGAQNEFAHRLSAMAERVNAAVEESNAKIKSQIEEMNKALETKTEEGLAQAAVHLKELQDEYEKQKEELEKDVDPATDLETRLKDSQAVLDLGDQVLEKGQPLQEAVLALKNEFLECDALIRNAIGIEGADTLKELVIKMRAKMIEFEKDVGTARRTVSMSVTKARTVNTNAKKQKEADERKAEEAKRLLWGAQQVCTANEIGMYVDQRWEKFSDADVVSDELKAARGELAGFLDQLQMVQRDQQYALCSQDIKQALSKIITKLKAKQQTVSAWQNKRNEDIADSEFAAHVQIAGHIDQFIKGNEDMDEEMFFQQMSGGADTVGVEKCAQFLKETVQIPVDIVDEHLDRLFAHALHYVKKHQPLGMEEAGEIASELASDEFSLHVGNCHFCCNRPIAMTSDRESPTDPSKKVAIVEAFDVVRVLEGPEMVSVEMDQSAQGLGLAQRGAARIAAQSGVQTQARMMPRVRCQRTICGSEGWVTLKAGMQSTFLQKFNPAHYIVQETVLTDIFDLQDFNVIRRVKKDEKCLCLGVPKFKSQDPAVGGNLLRIKVCALGTEGPSRDIGWVTVKGNNGAMFVKGDNIAHPVPRFVKGEEEGAAYEVEDPKAKETGKIEAEAFEKEEFHKKFSVFLDNVPVAVDAKLAKAEQKLKEAEEHLTKFANAVNPPQKGKKIIEPEDANWTVFKIMLVKDDKTSTMAHKAKFTTPEVIAEHIPEFDDAMKEIQGEMQPMRTALNALAIEFNAKPPRGSAIPEIPTGEGVDPVNVQATEAARKEALDNLSIIFKYAPMFQERHKKFTDLSSKILMCTARRDRMRLKLQQLYGEADKEAQRDQIITRATELNAEIATREEAVKESNAKLEAFRDSFTKEHKNAVDMWGKAQAAEEYVTVVKTEATDSLKWINEAKPGLYVSMDPLNPNSKKAPLKLDQPNNPVAVALQGFFSYQGSVQKLSGLANTVSLALKDVKIRAYQQGHEEIAFALKKKNITPEDLYTKMKAKQDKEDKREDDRLTAEVVANHFNKTMKIPTNVEIVQKAFEKACPLSADKTVGPEDVPFFNRILYRCTKDTLITGDVELGKVVNKIGKLYNGELFELLETGKTTEGGLYRVKGKTLESNFEGWATMRGNKGMVFLAPYVRGLNIKVSTDAEAITEMEDATSTVLYKPQRNDKLQLLTFPQKCGGTTALPLYRAQVRTINLGANLNDVNTEGWMTMNANTDPFVPLSYSPAFIKKQEDDAKKAEEEAAAAEAAAAQAAEDEAAAAEAAAEAAANGTSDAVDSSDVAMEGEHEQQASEEKMDVEEPQQETAEAMETEPATEM